MFAITLMSSLFIKNIRKVALSNNNAETFNKYVFREGKYSFSLPEGWDIESINSNNSDIDINFNNGSSIYGNISIIDGDLESVYKNITKEKDNIKMLWKDYKWNVITLKEDNYINKYYLRIYSEGKILILKFSYEDIKEKDSIKIVFDNIAMSFK